MAVPAAGFWEMGFSNDMREEIRNGLEQLNKKTERTLQIFRLMNRFQEEYIINFQKPENVPEVSNTLSATDCEQLNVNVALRQKLVQIGSHILQLRVKLTEKRLETLTELDAVQRKVVVDARQDFQRKQQLAYNGAPFDPKMIEELQQWCESLADIILANRNQIIHESELRETLPIDIPKGIEDAFPTLLTRVNEHLTALIKSTFLIEEQPVQVLKKDTKFQATVRLLVGGKLNLHYDIPRVEAILISEQQARDVICGKDITSECGDILNGKGHMQYHSGKLSKKFGNMKLRNDKKADETNETEEVEASEATGATNRRSRKKSKESKKATKGFQRPSVQRKVGESVLEEKLCLLFTSCVKLNGQQPLKLPIWTMSLPLIVTVHGNQKWKSEATVLWDNYFAEPGRVPFNIPQSAPWSDVANMLSLRFYGWTGRGLDERSIDYLANKLFGADQNRSEVSWTKFCKAEIMDGSFTFWEWFWSTGRLIKESLKEIWGKGLIIGFIDKTELVSQMISMPVGTFLLRFSERFLGGITIAWVKENPEMPGGKEIDHLQPFTIKALELRNLADRLHDITDLQYLYPDLIPKSEVFGQFKTAVDDPPGGYTPTTLVTAIPGAPAHGQPSTAAMDTSVAGSPWVNSDAPSPSVLNCLSQASPSLPDFNQMFQDQLQLAQGFNYPPEPQCFSQPFSQGALFQQQLQQGQSAVIPDHQENVMANGVCRSDSLPSMELGELTSFFEKIAQNSPPSGQNT